MTGWRLTGFVMTFSLALVVGCGQDKNPGGTQSPTQTPASNPTPTDTSPSTAITTAPTAPSKPSPPADPWELDTAKHVIPTQPVTGKVLNQDFKPTEISFEGSELRFAVETDNQRTVLGMVLPAKMFAEVMDGKRVTVSPQTSASGQNPEVTLTVPANPNPIQYPLVEGYALTLELAKKSKGFVEGKIYLVLPELEHMGSKHRSWFAGQFSTRWQRPAEVPPTAEDAPFVQGAVTVEGRENPTVKVGCVGTDPDADGMFVSESLEITLNGMGGSTSRDTAVLIVDSKQPGMGRYEFTHLPPGRYFVFAAVPGGPMLSKWLTVGENAQETWDVTLKDAATGSLEATLPSTIVGKVNLVPADDKLSFAVAATIGFNMGTAKEPENGKLTFENLPPGKYELWAQEKLGSAEVKPGETTRLDLTKK